MTGELKLTLRKLKPNEYLRYEKDKEANKKKRRTNNKHTKTKHTTKQETKKSKKKKSTY